MGQSLVRDPKHFVFSTKYRQPLILPAIEGKLFEYIGGICKNLKCQPIKIGGHLDHIHMLCFLSKHMCVVDLIEKVKCNSSKWMKTNGNEYHNFYWQNGYGCFAVEPNLIPIKIAYIANQHEHHKKQSFQDEYRGILKRYSVEYDERYLWD